MYLFPLVLTYLYLTYRVIHNRKYTINNSMTLVIDLLIVLFSPRSNLPEHAALQRDTHDASIRISCP